MVRSLELEWIDGKDFTHDEYAECLRQLTLINHLTMGYYPTLRALHNVATRNQGRTLRILDVGFGYGDTLRTIARWAKKNQIAVELVGVELNPQATQLAKEATPAEFGISFRTQDIFQMPEGERFDVIICALMTHHLTEAELRHLLPWLTAHAKEAWFINDLHRHWFPYWFIKIVTRVFGFNRLIQHDAPLSVQRSFRRTEWLRLAHDCGLSASRLRLNWWWSFRYGVFYDVR